MTTRKTAASKPAANSAPTQPEKPADVTTGFAFARESKPDQRRGQDMVTPFVAAITDLVDAGEVGTGEGFGFDFPTADKGKTRHWLDEASKQANDSNDVKVTARWSVRKTDDPQTLHATVWLVPRLRRGEK